MSSRVCDDSVFPLIPDIIRGVRKSGPGVLSASGNGCTGTAADVCSMMCGDSFTAFRTAPGKNGPGVWTFVFGCAHGGGMQEAMPCLRFGGLTDSDADALAAFFSAAVRQTLAAERCGTEKAEKNRKGRAGEPQMKNRKNTYGAGGSDAGCAGEEEITEGEFGTDGRPVPYMPDGAVCQCGGNIFTRELRNGRIFYQYQAEYHIHSTNGTHACG